jgi:hypothetical protein
MSLQGTGTNISRQEASDLLQKLIAESIQVQAMFVGRGGVTTAVRGTVSCPQDGLVLVSERRSPTDASLCFGLKDVSVFKYGDNRAFPGSSGITGTPRLSSALCFVYPDGAQVVLFEIEVRP